MLKVSESIANLDDRDIGDNLLYYDYNVKHLLGLRKKGIPEDDLAFLSAFRSFEGEVFENFIYEKLLRYAIDNQEIENFIVKGPHKKRTKALPNNLSINWKGQIVYRTRRNEIGEFDGIIFTKTELYFVEMTLVKSVTKLKRRLRKKKALLEVLFPHYEIKALLILNEGVTGLKQLPSYCTVWITKPFSAKRVYEWMKQPRRSKRKPFSKIKGRKIVTPDNIKVFPFKYYNTLTWILKNIRLGKTGALNMNFIRGEIFTRYHDLFTKVYIGYMDPNEFRILFPSVERSSPTEIVVAIEKEHTGAFTLNYFMQHSRKNVDIIAVRNGKIVVEKKDPYGVTVTEVMHILKTMKPVHRLTSEDIKVIEHQIREGASPDI